MQLSELQLSRYDLGALGSGSERTSEPAAGGREGRKEWVAVMGSVSE